MNIRFNCDRCGREYVEEWSYEGPLSNAPESLKEQAKQVTERCDCDENGEWYYFEYNRNAHTVDKLDFKSELNHMSLREYIKYGEVSGYFELEKPLEDMTTSELSHLVDYIDYLESK